MLKGLLILTMVMGSFKVMAGCRKELNDLDSTKKVFIGVFKSFERVDRGRSIPGSEFYEFKFEGTDFIQDDTTKQSLKAFGNNSIGSPKFELGDTYFLLVHKNYRGEFSIDKFYKVCNVAL